MSTPKVLGPDALPRNLDALSGEKQRAAHLEAAFNRERLQKLGTSILIQEPSAELVAFRTWLNHPANSDLATIAASRITIQAVLITLAAQLDYTLNSAATNADVDRIMGDIATLLRRRAGKSSPARN